jgi:RNA polymerase sigma-70 factor (ECF subfamily)
VVLAARDKTAQQSEQALEILCRTYWQPLYAYVRGWGRSPEDAEDLTQAFFARLLAKDYLQDVVRERGRFRSFLLMAFKRFLANEWDRVRAKKRGGGVAVVPVDTRLAERSLPGGQNEATSPDQVYDRQWALSLLDLTMARLREEYEKAGKAGDFACLKSFLTAERGEISYGEVATKLRTTEGAARVAVHRLRRRFREVYRAQVAHTVRGPGEIDDEIRHLQSALLG